jgi:hypothetical protein
VHTFHRRFKIDNLALAHAARWCLANTKNFDGAIGPAFSNDHTNFGCANLEPDHQIIARHYS